MPLYEYRCNDCGPFTALRKMSEASKPAFCDNCGGISNRLISVPNYALLGQSLRMAHERNEKSAHDPKVAKRSSCGCAGSHTCKTSTKVNPETGKAALQMQTKKTARPWMLSH